jgi:hypothetical protein
MKNTDIAMIILVASISVVVSYFLGNSILGDPNDRVETLSYMDPISDSVEQPDIETFNPAALNPTVEVYVGNCGPLEAWDDTKRVCVSKSSLEEEESEGEEESEDEGDTTPRITPDDSDDDDSETGDE